VPVVEVSFLVVKKTEHVKIIIFKSILARAMEEYFSRVWHSEQLNQVCRNYLHFSHCEVFAVCFQNLAVTASPRVVLVQVLTRSLRDKTASNSPACGCEYVTFFKFNFCIFRWHCNQLRNKPVYAYKLSHKFILFIMSVLLHVPQYFKETLRVLVILFFSFFEYLSISFVLLVIVT